VVELTRVLQRELGIAVIFSSHEINPLLGALDRVLHLGSGQAALGTVDKVITGPVLSELMVRGLMLCTSTAASS
jgi:zinc/manganese transport system ATP-binding protein